MHDILRETTRMITTSHAKKKTREKQRLLKADEDFSSILRAAVLVMKKRLEWHLKERDRPRCALRDEKKRGGDDDDEEDTSGVIAANCADREMEGPLLGETVGVSACGG